MPVYTEHIALARFSSEFQKPQTSPGDVTRLCEEYQGQNVVYDQLRAQEAQAAGAP